MKIKLFCLGVVLVVACKSKNPSDSGEVKFSEFFEERNPGNFESKCSTKKKRGRLVINYELSFKVLEEQIEGLKVTANWEDEVKNEDFSDEKNLVFLKDSWIGYRNDNKTQTNSLVYSIKDDIISQFHRSTNFVKLIHHPQPNEGIEEVTVLFKGDDCVIGTIPSSNQVESKTADNTSKNFVESERQKKIPEYRGYTVTSNYVPMPAIPFTCEAKLEKEKYTMKIIAIGFPSGDISTVSPLPKPTLMRHDIVNNKVDAFAIKKSFFQNPFAQKIWHNKPSISDLTFKLDGKLDGKANALIYIPRSQDVKEVDFICKKHEKKK